MMNSQISVFHLCKSGLGPLTSEDTKKMTKITQTQTQSAGIRNENNRSFYGNNFLIFFFKHKLLYSRIKIKFIRRPWFSFSSSVVPTGKKNIKNRYTKPSHYREEHYHVEWPSRALDKNALKFKITCWPLLWLYDI